jgi:hypothetical protein
MAPSSSCNTPTGSGGIYFETDAPKQSESIIEIFLKRCLVFDYATLNTPSKETEQNECVEYFRLGEWIRES